MKEEDHHHHHHHPDARLAEALAGALGRIADLERRQADDRKRLADYEALVSQTIAAQTEPKTKPAQTTRPKTPESVEASLVASVARPEHDERTRSAAALQLGDAMRGANGAKPVRNAPRYAWTILERLQGNPAEVEATLAAAPPPPLSADEVSALLARADELAAEGDRLFSAGQHGKAIEVRREVTRLRKAARPGARGRAS